MATPRYNQISLDETPWYHVVSRCVRRAYLCGTDHNTGQSYEHRRDWVANRIKYLACIFTIDIAAYAIMHNHYHLVVRVDDERVQDLSTEEVVRRWTSLYKGPLLVQRYVGNERQDMSEGELRQVDMLATVYRERLCNLSWFMKNLNQYIARRANAEDQVTGHFWESRYKCQALLDEKAVLAAMAYTDLNPVRAGMTESLEESAYTSVSQRVKELKTLAENNSEAKIDTLKTAPVSTEEPAGPHENDYSPAEPATASEPVKQAPLLPFDAAAAFRASVPFVFDDYLDLLDIASRVVHPNKRGAVPERAPRLLAKYNISLAAFIEHSNHFIECFGNHAGDPERMTALAAKRNSRYLRGVAKARLLFGEAEEAA